MCNTYTLRRDFMKARRRPGGMWNLTEAQLQNLEHGEQWIIRPTRPAPVYVLGSGLRLMRWGFERPWAKAINNARIEKAESPMWKKAWSAGRCLIPMSGWYEFTGPAGQMSAHLLEAEDGGELLAAGLWEEHATLGDCFTMLMTASSGVMEKIHTRMPVILGEEAGEEFVSGKGPLPAGPVLDFRVRIVPSPLKKNRDPMVQDELF